MSVVALLALLKLNLRAAGNEGRVRAMPGMRVAGGEDSACRRRGGVGRMLGRSLEAAFRRGEVGSCEVEVRGVECVGVWDWEPGGEGAGMLRRWIAEEGALARMKVRWESVRLGSAEEMESLRTLVGEPWGWLDWGCKVGWERGVWV